MNNLALIEVAVGTLFLLDLAFYLPYRRVVLGEGYWDRFPWASPAGRALFAAAWIAACASLVLQFLPLLGAVVLVVLCRRFYITSRWNTIFRGGGAPGFMSHYAAVMIAVVEGARLLDSSGSLENTATLVFQIDFAVILLCSGTYKCLSGYLQGEGMSYGLANPMWGYWHKLTRRIPPAHPLLRAQDAAAALAQLTMGTLMLIPGLRWAGAAICMAGFFGLAFLVRLGRLAILMAVIPLMYLPDLGWSLTGALPTAEVLNAFASPDPVVVALQALLWAYVVLLVPVKVMQYVNLFLSRRFPGPVQRFLTAYANTVPIIMWRVFTPDVTNFFVRIHARGGASGSERRIVDENGVYDMLRWRGDIGWKLRFLHVTESIALTTVFTTLKYFSSDRDLFERRLVAYARTLPVPPSVLGPSDRELRFEYVAIIKGLNSFEYHETVNFLVDLDAGTVREERIVPGFNYSEPAQHSHIKETQGFGNYVPA